MRGFTETEQCVTLWSMGSADTYRYTSELYEVESLSLYEYVSRVQSRCVLSEGVFA
jgi:hypothetical protein